MNQDLMVNISGNFRKNVLYFQIILLVYYHLNQDVGFKD